MTRTRVGRRMDPSFWWSDVAPGCGVHAFFSSSFTAVRLSFELLRLFLVRTGLRAQSLTRAFGIPVSESKNLKNLSSRVMMELLL